MATKLDEFKSRVPVDQQDELLGALIQAYETEHKADQQGHAFKAESDETDAAADAETADEPLLTEADLPAG